MNDSLKTLLIVGVLILILWNLGRAVLHAGGQGTDQAHRETPYQAIGLSIALVLFVVLAIYMGWITPHGVGRSPG